MSRQLSSWYYRGFKQRPWDMSKNDGLGHTSFNQDTVFGAVDGMRLLIRRGGYSTCVPNKSLDRNSRFLIIYQVKYRRWAKKVQRKYIRS